jgi:hypothetical protein
VHRLRCIGRRPVEIGNFFADGAKRDIEEFNRAHGMVAGGHEATLVYPAIHATKIRFKPVKQNIAIIV